MVYEYANWIKGITSGLTGSLSVPRTSSWTQGWTINYSINNCFFLIFSVNVFFSVSSSGYEEKAKQPKKYSA